MNSSLKPSRFELYSRKAQTSIPRLQNLPIIVSQPLAERGEPFEEDLMLKVLDQSLNRLNIDLKEIESVRVCQHFVGNNTKKTPQYGKYYDEVNSLEIDFDIDSTEVRMEMEIEMKNGRYRHASTLIRIGLNLEYLSPIMERFP